MVYSAGPNTVTIPPALDELLRRDGALAGDVYRAIAEFTPWLSLSGMPFFPYYTDHGPAYVTGVLNACEALVSSRSWEVLTPADAAVLVLSTLLHDSALHIREEGFVTLVSGDWKVEINGFSDREWPVVWDEFVGEARRWDAKRLMKIFGSVDPVTLPNLGRIEDWSQRERLFVGEFLRRHHPRIAHEMAIGGVPGPQDRHRLSVPDPLSDFADLAGVVARSHGLDVRACMPYLEAAYGNVREFRGVHAVFLMGVLRVADYIQIPGQFSQKYTGDFLLCTT
jgi:molecular chaperone HtpG